MISAFLGTGLLGNILRSGVIVAVMLTWHYIDKGVAVRSAEKALADQVEIETLRAEIKESKRRLTIAKEEKERFEESLLVTKADSERFQKEIEEYEKNTADSSVPVVGDLIHKLRNK